MTLFRGAAAALTLLVSLASTGAPVADPWSWPVAPPHSIARPFIAPATPYSAGHRGIDVLAPDAIVTAPADGVVRFSGVVVDRPVISVDHGGGVVSSYEPVISELKKGDAVSRGDPIGEVIAGHCSSVCLHFGVRIDGEYVSPLTLLGDVPYAILLPTRR